MAAGNALTSELKRLVDHEWESGIKDEDLKYKMYDLHEPHCNEAVEYPEVTGKKRYRCKHNLL